MRSLYELAVSVRGPDEIDDPRHCEITIEPTVVGALVLTDNTEAAQDEALREFGAPDGEALREAGRYHAGVLARLASALTPWIDYSRVRDRCAQGGPLIDDSYCGGRPVWWESCSISAAGLIDNSDGDYHQPYLYCYVPVGEQAEWLTRIRDTLSAIAAAEQ
jgi:hypothetical protein